MFPTNESDRSKTCIPCIRRLSDLHFSDQYDNDQEIQQCSCVYQSAWSCHSVHHTSRLRDMHKGKVQGKLFSYTPKAGYCALSALPVQFYPSMHPLYAAFEQAWHISEASSNLCASSGEGCLLRVLRPADIIMLAVTATSSKHAALLLGFIHT